ncbi:hypothetical protein PLICRDRAFT_43983 [Plicaturopsis crispa FD-325 SS-3]|nr:hypothetical protein PLICRDRAFT_43983 [Plicaturopsis crispa FD-325 SS-3]
MHSVRNPFPLRRAAFPRSILVPRHARWLNTQDGGEPTSAGTYESKYAEKLKQRAQEKGLSVAELRARAREEEQKRERIRSQEIAAKAFPAPPAPAASSSSSARPPPTPAGSVRKDSSPVKPLSSILNIPRLLATPHTPAQIGALWTAYHASKSGGTGRGFICAAVPVDLYETMADVAKRYAAFVVPVPRPKNADTPPTVGEVDTAYEFYFQQWDFHGAPPAPSAAEPELFAPPPPAPAVSPNPQTATVLFTPLQEYKLRNSFATPYLVLTFYTDLARSHGVVLLRGEITPSAASDGASAERYLLSQADAQLLTMGLQKFYLWEQSGKGEKEGERLLKLFHEKPDEFKYEDLLKHANITA